MSRRFRYNCKNSLRRRDRPELQAPKCRSSGTKIRDWVDESYAMMSPDLWPVLYTWTGMLNFLTYSSSWSFRCSCSEASSTWRKLWSLDMTFVVSSFLSTSDRVWELYSSLCNGMSVLPDHYVFKTFSAWVHNSNLFMGQENLGPYPRVPKWYDLPIQGLHLSSKQAKSTNAN